MQESGDAVVLTKISKAFSDRPVLSEVDLCVARGEILSIVGPSGCGKSTLLRIIAGLEQPGSGTVALLGQDVTSAPPSLRPVNTVFQSYALFPHLTVFENVAFPLRIRRVGADDTVRRVQAILELTSIADLKDRRPNQLSGGQQQRVAVARALVNEPAVVLLDEPLAALDRFLRQTLQDELRKLQRRVGSTFIFVTHDQDEAFAMSDRVAVMSGGRLEQVGTQTEVYGRPATRFVAEFIGDSTIIEGTVRSVSGDLTHVETAAGLFAAASRAHPFAAGDRTAIVVRPERIETGPVGETNTVSGSIREIRMKGSVADVLLATPHLEILVRTTPRLAAQWTENPPSGWHFPADALHLVPANGTKHG